MDQVISLSFLIHEICNQYLRHTQVVVFMIEFSLTTNVLRAQAYLLTDRLHGQQEISRWPNTFEIFQAVFLVKCG